jgi:transcriptional regulator with XRE-family HTH domain
MNRLNFGSVIKEYRVKKGWTQAELANQLGYDGPQFVSLLERNQSKPPLYVLGQLIVLLQIPEQEIVTKLVQRFQENVKSQINKGKKMASGQSS